MNNRTNPGNNPNLDKLTAILKKIQDKEILTRDFEIAMHEIDAKFSQIKAIEQRIYELAASPGFVNRSTMVAADTEIYLRSNLRRLNAELSVMIDKLKTNFVK